MFVFDPGRQGRSIRGRSVSAESRSFFGAEMFWTIGGSYDFDVGKDRLRSLVGLVVDSSIGNLNLIAKIREVEPLGDFLPDLSKVAVRFSLPGAIDCLLNLVFQFKIKLESEILTSTALDALDLFEVGAVNLRIVLHFTWLYEAVVQPLIQRKLAGLTGELLAVLGEGYDFDPLGTNPASVISRRHSIDSDQVPLRQISKVRLQRLCVAAVDCPGNVFHSENPETTSFGEQHLFLGAKPESSNAERYAIPGAARTMLYLTRLLDRIAVGFDGTISTWLRNVVATVFAGAFLKPF